MKNINKLAWAALPLMLVGCGSETPVQKEDNVSINTYKLSANFVGKTPVAVSSNKSSGTLSGTGDNTVSKSSTTTPSTSQESSIDSFLSVDGTLTAALNDFVIDSSLVAEGEILFTIRNVEPTDPSYVEPTESELNDPNATIPSSFDNYTMTNKCLVFKGNLSTNQISCLSSNIEPFSGALSGLKTSKGWIIAGTQIDWGNTVINEQGWYDFTSKNNYGLHLIEETGPKHILMTEFKPEVIVANETQESDSLAVSSPYKFLEGTTYVVQNIGEDTQTVSEIPYSATAIQFSGNGLYMQNDKSGFIVAEMENGEVKYGRSGTIAIYDKFNSKLYKFDNPDNKLEGTECLHLHEISPFSPNQRGVGIELDKKCQNKFKISDIYNGKAIFIQKNGDNYLVNKLDINNQANELLCELESVDYDTQGMVYNGTAMGYHFKHTNGDNTYCGFDWIDGSMVTNFQYTETIDIKDNGVSKPAKHNSDKVITLDAGAMKGYDRDLVVAVVSSKMALNVQSVVDALSVRIIERADLEEYMTIVDGETISVYFEVDHAYWRAENVLVDLDQTLLKDTDGNQVEFEGDAIIVFNKKYQ